MAPSFLSYLIWNGSPEIFTIGWLSLRWYGLLFASGFLISQQILYYMFKKEGRPQGDVDTLTIYMVIATILGARLGHIFFYQPEILWQDPLGVLLPFEFTPEFKFTGLRGLASHGAAIGILFILWLYSNYLIIWAGANTVVNEGNAAVRDKVKKGFNIIKRVKPGQSYIQTLDRIVILVMLCGALIRLGNFFNSEIIGKPTDAPTAVVFANNTTERMLKAPGSPVETIEVKKGDAATSAEAYGIVPVNIYIIFKPGTTEDRAHSFMTQEAQFYLSSDTEFFAESNARLQYQVVPGSDGIITGKILTRAIARHPSQLYESITCFVFFLVLLWLWSKGKVESQPGLIFGIFMVVLWSLRFAYEFLKEPQVEFENSLPINMGQILSIPLIIVGIIILVRALKPKS